jgi:hypothetical protein
MIGEPASPYDVIEAPMGMIEFPEEDEEDKSDE